MPIQDLLTQRLSMVVHLLTLRHSCHYEALHALDRPVWIFRPVGGGQAPIYECENALLHNPWRDFVELLASGPLRPRGGLRSAPGVCRRCHARDLDHFYTSRQDGTQLCPACFDAVAAVGAAKETPP